MLTGKRMSRGVAIEALADFALQHRAEFGQWLAEKSTWAGHPLMDPNIGFDMGETDANTVDEVLYGKPRRR
jgi:hypothetical protein